MNDPCYSDPSTNETIWVLSGQVSEEDGVRRISVNQFPFEVGRRSEASLSLPCGGVSKSHALFLKEGDQLVLRDLNSTNGTYVNGQQIYDSVPVNEGDLIQFASIVFRLGIGQHHTETRTLHEDACDRALTMMQFDRLLNDGGVLPFFQPIIKVADQSRIGFEVLGRSRLFGLKTPKEMFSAASKLNLEAELSRVMRAHAILLSAQLPTGMNFFLNTHPVELAKEGLYESLKELRRMAPNLPITLEIHETAITNAKLVVELKKLLADIDMKLAFDDFGVGRARLVELSEVRPDFVKFDMKLTREIHRASSKRQEVVALIAKMVNDLGISSLAEGVECEESHCVLQQMNFTLAQGFYYGRPEPASFYAENAEPSTDSTDG